MCGHGDPLCEVMCLIDGLVAVFAERDHMQQKCTEDIAHLRVRLCVLIMGIKQLFIFCCDVRKVL